MDIIERVTSTIEPSLTAMGYNLVQVKMADGARRKTLSIMAERLDDVFMSFDDCTNISQTVSALLDVDDPITSAYDLEVLSPGLDRPLTKLADFTRYANYEIKCDTLIPVEGRKRFKGLLKGITGQTITVTVENVELQFPFANLRSAKLVVTDSLVADTLRKQKHAEEAAEKEAKAQKKQTKQKKKATN